LGRDRAALNSSRREAESYELVESDDCVLLRRHGHNTSLAV
jgi:hypothetical protein